MFGSFRLSFGSDQTITTIQRLYKYDLLDWLADVGGYFVVLCLVAGILVAPIASLNLRRELVGKIFKYLPKTILAYTDISQIKEELEGGSKQEDESLKQDQSLREGFRDRQVIRLREAISTLGESRMRLSIADMKRTIYSADEEHKQSNSPVKLMDETINEKALYIEPN